MKKLLLAFIFLVSTTGAARAELPMIDVSLPLLLTTCGIPGEPSLCNCNGQAYINHGTHYCTASGLIPIQVGDPSTCPDRVFNGFMPEQDSRCGSAASNSDWGPQEYFGVSFPLWGCVDHDFCYSNCRAQRIDCDNRLLQGLTDGCNTIGSWPQRRTCHRIARLYYGLVRFGGEVSYIISQGESCQCGPQTQCNGGLVICLFYNQEGCDGWTPIPGWPGFPIGNPQPGFPGIGVPFPGADF